MIALPIPLIVSLVAVFVLAQSLSSGAPLRSYHALLVACALQSGLISLVHHYGFEELRLLQPVVATAVPALAWIAFETSFFRPFQLRWALQHLASPAFVLFCVLFAPITLDVVIPGVFVGYGGAILWALRRDSPPPLARLDAGGVPLIIWRAMAAALILSALSDVLIAWAMSAGRFELRPLIISSFSSLALLAIILLALSRNGVGEAPPEEHEPKASTPSPENAAVDTALLERLDKLLRDEKMYLDPELTLARLARKLTVPVKQLSTSINRAAGQNVSRYVNAFRIEHAQEMLRGGAPVTQVVFASGFNTKSNFNREFRRVTGSAPTEWLQSNGGAANGRGAPLRPATESLPQAER